MPFSPGKSGNPVGRKKGVRNKLGVTTRDWAITMLPEVKKALIKALKGEDVNASVRAAGLILDRALGKVPQAIEGNIGLTPGTVAELMAMIRGDAPSS